jgi:hypothetical protein
MPTLEGFLGGARDYIGVLDGVVEGERQWRERA